MLSEIHVRYATAEDIELLVSSAVEMMRETEYVEWSPDTARSGILKIMANRERGFYVVAEYDGKTIGSLEVSPHWLDVFDGCIWWLQMAYIKPEFRQLGAHTALRKFVFEAAVQNSDVKDIRSLVHPDNLLMQRINETHGWTKLNYYTYKKEIRSVG
jgi:hypothetical protein